MTDFEKTEQIARLLVAKKNRTLTPAEKQVLDDWLQENAGNQKIHDSLMDDARISAKMKELSGYDVHKAFDKFIQTGQKRSARFIRRALRVAAVLIPFLFGIYFLFQKDEPAVVEQPVAETTIEPGSSRAILKLADGTVVDLEKEAKKIATENGTVINNNKKEVVYQKGQEQAKPQEVEYNSIEIPRGGEYQLTLSDGTRVWLNSETSIRFPVFFLGKKRDVQLTGEAYFEVAENKNMPFIVHTGETDIHVTGTAFNVRAYSGEKNMAATLVEGEVNVIRNQTKETLRLKPGQQAVVSGLETHVGEVNVEQFIAWKNGRIYFENNSLEEILSNLARWYDVEVNYTDENLKKLRFSIDVERYTEFNRVFEIIELTRKVKFSINKNEVTVMKGE
jgi:transmembrane sensor